MKVLKTTAAGLLVLLVVIAPPYLLIRFIGNPYPPEGLDLAAPLTDNAIMGLIAVLVWILWAQFMLSLFVEGYAAFTDRAVDVRMPVFGVQQDLARALVAAVITTAVVAPLSMGSADPAAAAGPAPTATDSTSGSFAPQLRGSVHQDREGRDAAAEPAGRDCSTATAPTPAPREKASERATEKTTEKITVTVQRGDSLWSLAETYLGDGDRWAEIAAANSGQTMTDGLVFTSANQIKAGWHIAIPGVPAAGSAHHQHTEPYRVEAGDTLSGIAEDQLGDATRFPEIFAASRNITQPDGQHLRDPDVIDVGWTVAIPGQGRPRSGVPADTAGQPGDRPGTSASRTHQSAPRPARPADTKVPDTKVPDSKVPEPMAPETAAAPEAAAPGAPSGMSVPEGSSATQSPAARRGGGDQETAGGQTTLQQPPLVLMTGAGVVLAGGLLLGLRARRRAQLRARRPGRAIAAPSGELSSVEASIAASTGAAATVDHMDAALRRLAAWSARERKPMPTLAAVELAHGALGLHLTAPARLPAPWDDATGEQLHWRAPVTPADTEANTADSSGTALLMKDAEEVDAPYPLLVTVGSAAAGEVWLLNCEELGEVRITGDADLGRDFARYLLAELAMNPWSEQARVDCVAIGAEVAPMNPDRVDHHAAAGLEEAAGAAVADAVITIDRAASAGAGPPTGRTGQLDEDVWPARIVVVDATETRSAPDQGPERHALQQLRELVGSHPGQTGTAVMLVAEEDAVKSHSSPAAVEIRVRSDGRLSVPSVGLDLVAVGLSSEEAHGCAALLTQSEDLDDVEIPVDGTAKDGWQAYVDSSGALRREHTLPRSQPAEELKEAVGCFLDAPTEAYVRAAATTAEDLERLAPRVPVRLRPEIEAKDPDLDQDVDDWFDDSCRRPRLALLGPVTVRACGRPLTARKPYMTELVAYLASRRPNGVTAARVASTFHITTQKAHTYIQIARAWLGTNPTTGQPYLPHAAKAPSAQASGVGIYQLDDDVLVDRDLFLRLRARGQARNADGTSDLQRALSLVSGRPFDQLRDGGWEWLPALEPSDVSCAIADVAFLVTTRCLETGDLEQAREAANMAIFMAPNSEAAQLSRAALVEAEGDRVEAERIVREEICNRSDDGKPPAELSERTQAIIRSRGWLKGARQT